MTAARTIPPPRRPHPRISARWRYTRRTGASHCKLGGGRDFRARLAEMPLPGQQPALARLNAWLGVGVRRDDGSRRMVGLLVDGLRYGADPRRS